MPHRPARARGFTLVEIMIAVSIMALVLAVGAPVMFQGMQKEGLRKAVSDVVEACSHARAFAILKGVPTELVIRAEDGQISVEQVRDSNLNSLSEPDGSARPAAAGARPNFSARLDDDIIVELVHVNFIDQMEFPETRVRFFPNGTSDEFSIILRSIRGKQMISLDVVTALANVQTLQ
jgi:prepilin-type N-terminal cleavage/methylation domain-containing protein